MPGRVKSLAGGGVEACEVTWMVVVEVVIVLIAVVSVSEIN